MQFGYTRRLFHLVASPKRALVVIGLLVLPTAMRVHQSASAQTLDQNLAVSGRSRVDARTVRLARFFAQLHCPVQNLSEDFIRAADENHLDWRLLPSISVIESGGGKAYRNNNIFGWNSLQLFPSIRHGIQEVAFRLGRSPLYRDQDTIGKLRRYNPNDGYAQNVVNVMNRISPNPNVGADPNRAYEFQRD